MDTLAIASIDSPVFRVDDSSNENGTGFCRLTWVGRARRSPTVVKRRQKVKTCFLAAERIAKKDKRSSSFFGESRVGYF
jgi:hypothetical protein